MAGFSLSAEELERVCHRMRVHSDQVLDHVSTGDVGPMDLGGARYAELARHYAEVLDEAVPRMLREFRSATQAVTRRLEATLAAYLAADDERARAFR